MPILAFCHVEDVARNQPAIEAIQVEETEEVYQEQQLQEFEVADQVEEQILESNFANTDLQQRQAPVHVNPRVHTLHLSLTFSIYTCALRL